MIPWNDIAALEAAIGDDVAAVIMEPLSVNGGVIAAGKRLPRGGARPYDPRRRRADLRRGDHRVPALARGRAGLLGVTPDLTVLGKARRGGFPLSVVCGRRDILEVVASGKMAHVGTFNANPVCAAAALAAIRILEQRRGDHLSAARAPRLGARTDLRRRDRGRGAWRSRSARPLAPSTRSPRPFPCRPTRHGRPAEPDRLPCVRVGPAGSGRPRDPARPHVRVDRARRSPTCRRRARACAPRPARSARPRECRRHELGRDRDRGGRRLQGLRARARAAGREHDASGAARSSRSSATTAPASRP